MKKKTFLLFMDNQLCEIMQYVEFRQRQNPMLDSNLLALEWIEKNAKCYRENWEE